MPFLGKSPKAGNYILLDSITTSATATYNLTRNSTAYFPESARNLIVSLNGITQAPDTAYSVSGSTITFSSALTSSDVIDYILVLGEVLTLNTPADNTVGTNQMSYPLGNFSSTGIDDNATSTAMTISSSGETTFTGDVVISEATPSIRLDDSDNADGELQIVQGTGNSFYRTRGVSGNGAHVFQRNDGTTNLKIFQTNTGGDVIFYDDDGSTEGMRWDASTDRLGIGTTDPLTKLDVRSDYIIAGTGSSTSGTKILSGYYNTDGDEAVTIGTSRSSAALVLGYGCYPSSATADAFLSSADNVAWARGALSMDNELVYRSAASSTTTVGSSVTLTERFKIDSNGDTKISNQLYFGTNLGDVISLYDDRLGDANMYGFGVESSALFSRSLSYFNWYVNQTNDGSSYSMQLNGNGRLVLKGSESASNAAEVYFMDDGSPGLVGGIEFTGTNGNGGGYHSSLKSSGELQYSAAGHLFADTSVVSGGIPTFWCRMNGDMTIGTYSSATVLTEYLFDVSAGHLHIDGTLYQNSSSTNSDSKMKENVVTLADCLNKVSQLRGVEFDWKDEYVREAYHDVGLIAQEVESVIPEVVSEHEIGVGKKAGTGETLKSVDYARLTAVLIEAVKELKIQNEALETRIAALESN